MNKQFRPRTGYWKAIATAGILAAGTQTSHAEEPAARAIGQPPAPGTHIWEFGPEVFNYFYEEPGLMEYEGLMLGFYGQLTYHLRGSPDAQNEGEDSNTPAPRPSPWVFRADGRLAFGRTDYDGALQDGTPYAISGVDARSIEARLLFGRRFETVRGMTTLFAGLGHRYKDDDSSFDPAGYKRESRYLYLPITAEYIHTLSRGRALIMSVEYTHLISGEQISDLNSMGIGKVTNEQRSGYGLRGAVGYAHPWRRGHAIIEAFVRHWDIDDSEIESVFIRTPRGIGVVQFIEPENKTIEAGLSLRYRF